MAQATNSSEVESQTAKYADLQLNVLKCSICLELYNESRRPRTLFCGHTFCSTCLERVSKNIKTVVLYLSYKTKIHSKTD